MSDWAYALGAGLHNLQQSNPPIPAPGVYGAMLPPEASQPAPVAAPLSSFMRGLSGQAPTVAPAAAASAPAAAARPAALARPTVPVAVAQPPAAAGGMPGYTIDGSDRNLAGNLLGRGYRLTANADGSMSATPPSAPAPAVAGQSAPTLPGFQDVGPGEKAAPQNALQQVVRGGHVDPVGGGLNIHQLALLAPAMHEFYTGAAQREYLSLMNANANRPPKPGMTPDEAQKLRNGQVANLLAGLAFMTNPSYGMYTRMNQGAPIPGFGSAGGGMF